MRELNPHNSSFLYNSLYKQSPYNDWIQFAKTLGELQDLLKTFHIMPKEWLSWVDAKVEKSIKRNIEIHDQLNYRLSILWNGVILLQETKYICDVLENALRQLITKHINTHDLTFKNFSEFVYRWKKIMENYEPNNGKVNLSNMITTHFLMTLSFHQITEIIYAGWKTISTKSPIPGFGIYFRGDKNCRDLNMFRRDMEIIRHSRNAIAHTHKLFSHEEAQNLGFLGSSPKKSRRAGYCLRPNH
jgi:hypothetical protein